MNEVNIYVELLDEGSPTLRPTTAILDKDGLYKILPCPDYDPEDESWDFLPGSLVQLAEETLYDGSVGLIAKHPDSTAVRVYVDAKETFAPPSRNTYAIPLGNGLYEIQATPHYTAAQLWEFPPGSIVRLKPLNPSHPEREPFLAVAP